MKLNTNKAAFGQHETFPMRYGWMTKGVEALTKSPDFFAKPEEAMIELGIGSNMVRALQYWLRVTGIARFDQGEGIVTPLGEALIGDKGDQYLEDEATLWIIHWLIASNAELATGFFWFFNHYAIPRFQDKDALQALSEFVASELKTNRSLSTLKSDISTLLRMYAPVTGKADEHLDSPLGQLQLVERDEGHSHRSLRSIRPFLPPIALHFALQQIFFAQPKLPAIPIRSLLYGGDGWVAPGAVFRLSEEGLMDALHRVMEIYPKHYELRETAGLHQLYRSSRANDAVSVLHGYYQGGRIQ
jgi:hypothetical protein